MVGRALRQASTRIQSFFGPEFTVFASNGTVQGYREGLAKNGGGLIILTDEFLQGLGECLLPSATAHQRAEALDLFTSGSNANVLLVTRPGPKYDASNLSLLSTCQVRLNDCVPLVTLQTQLFAFVDVCYAENPTLWCK